MHTVWILPKADESLSETLHAAGWLVTFSGGIPNTQLVAAEPDVVIYDVGPGPLSDDFMAFCSMKFFPLLALAANWDVAWDAVEAGADDAMVTPISSAELLFRARKLVQQAKIVRVDDLAIDLNARRTKCGNRVITLSPVEFRLLACLAKHVGEAVSFDEILDEVWGTDPEQGGTLEQVKSAVKHLRRKIEHDPRHPDFIITIRGFGFRLRSQAQWDEHLR
jgi:two-component system KDP operon response regulator KdpE